jgi:hypothetical protein
MIESRIHELLEQVIAERWKQSDFHRTPQGWFTVNPPSDLRWMVALRRVDQSGDTGWLIKLLRSERECHAVLKCHQWPASYWLSCLSGGV